MNQTFTHGCGRRDLVYLGEALFPVLYGPLDAVHQAHMTPEHMLVAHID